ncbi:MAG: hypothetical protein JO142_21695 [Burkholderiales bacterium]|nr:hypothetical protein [Burkholderiales bacterium]
MLIANGAVHDVSTFFRAVVLAGLLAMTPAGWSFLNRYFTPGGGYIFLTARWLNAFLHLTLSVLLGIVVGPYQIWVSIRDIAELRRINAGILAGGYV